MIYSLIGMGLYGDYIASLIVIKNHKNKINIFDIIINIFSILCIGTGLFAQVENWDFFDSFYYCVIISITTGYGEIYPKTDFGKIITIIYSLVSLNLFSRLLLYIKESIYS